MKLTLPLLALAAVALGDSSRTDGTPIGKVVSMLQGMLTKGKAMKIQERVEFSKFSSYCDITRKETISAIKLGADNIVQQTADIGKALSDAEVLAEDIKEQQDDVTKMEKDLAGAKAIRKKERGDYEATHKDFTESIDAVAKATKVIKAKSKDVPQALLQIAQTSLIPAEAKEAIQSFIVLGQSAEGPPQAKAYESQSGGVIAILEKLKLKFEDQKTELEKEEASTKAAFELLDQKLSDSIKDGKNTISDKSAEKAKRMGIAADTKGDLEVTKKGKAADETKLTDLNVECDSKSQEYDKNQVTRAEEIKAMETCVGVLNSDDVSGAADKHKMSASLLDTDSAISLLQLRGDNSEKRRHLVSFLEGRANKLGSKYLSVVAARAVTDPFGKVKQMIKDLIVKLMEEANSEADNKAYCDSELGKNRVTRDGKTNEVEELTATIEKLTADLSKTKGDVGDLSQEISDLRSSQKQATEIRDEEKATNAETVSEAKSGQIAVERAKRVMQDFYAKASEASFLQDSDASAATNEMMDVTHAPYKGMQGSSDGLVGMLTTIISDFARLESNTASAEDEAASKYQTFMDASTQDVEVKGVEMDHLEKKSQTTDESIRNLKKELEATQDELDAALNYFEKLKPDCVDTGASYKDRVEMRQAEIQSLQEAVKAIS